MIFKRPRKGKLTEDAKTSRNVIQHFSVRLPVGIPYEKLGKISQSTAIFTSLPSSKIDDKPASDWDTVTSEKNEDSLLQEPVTTMP